MADREKLIILLNDHVCLNQDACKEECNACLADHLIANGVTVGKPLTEYLHPVDAYEGLKAKYLVFKADTGERIADCFVLRPAKDPAAVEALRAYANASENKVLAEDILNWVGKGTNVPTKTMADRIRAMSDEELASYWAEHYDEFCPNKPECGAILDAENSIPDGWCATCVLEWLRKPVED